MPGPKRVVLELLDSSQFDPAGSAPIQRALKRSVYGRLEEYSVGELKNESGLRWLLYENPAGCTAAISERRLHHRLELRQFARSLISQLGRLHSAGLLLARPLDDNILWNPDSSEVLLVGLDNALPSELIAFHPGLPAQLSCSEAVEIHRVHLDQRTDLYFAGVLLSSLFSGDEVGQIPREFTSFLAALSAANPELRYQSAQAALADLAEIGNGSVLQPARFRGSSTYHVTRRLHGVEVQRQTLAACITRLLERRPGPVEYVTIEGPPGTGKSVLCERTMHEVSRGRAVLLRGQFDPIHSAIPLSAIVEAIASYLRKALESSEEDRECIQRIVGELPQDTVAALRVALPELMLFLDTTEEASNDPRYHRQTASALVSLISTLGSHRPVCLFLDDCEWFDYPSLELLRTLASQEAVRLLIIMAFRPGEGVNPSFLSATIEDLSLRSVPLERIRLAPLNAEQCTDIVAESIGDTPESVRSKIEFGISAISAAGFLELMESPQLQSHVGPRPDGLGLEIRKRLTIGEEGADESVPRTRQNRAIPSSIKEVLGAATLFGHGFELSGLLSVIDLDADRIAEVLLLAVSEGYIQPESGSGASTGRFRFADQATSSMFEPSPEVIGKLSNRLADHFEELFDDHGPEGIYQAAESAHRAWSISAHNRTAPFDELYRVRQERAATAALEAGTYRTAAHYLERLHAIDEATSQSSDSFFRWVEALVAAGELEKVEALLSSRETSPETDWEAARRFELQARARLKGVQINQDLTQETMRRSYREVRDFLRKYGIRIPDRSSPVSVTVNLFASAFNRRRLGIVPSLNEPSELEQALGRLVVHSASLAVFVDPRLSLQIHLLIARLMRRRRPIVQSPLSLAFLGSLISVSIGRPAVGKRFGDIAATMIDHPANHPFRGSTMFQLYAAVYPMTSSFRKWEVPLREAYFTCAESSDGTVAGLCHFIRLLHRLMAGDPAKSLLDDISRHPGLSIVAGPRLMATNALHQIVLNLSRRDPEPWRLLGPIHDEREQDPQTLTALAPSVLSAFVATVHGELHYAWSRLQIPEAEFDSVASLPVTILIDFLLCFCSAGLLRRSTGRLRRSYARLRRAACQNPSNFAHLYSLATGERHRARGRARSAREHYERALEAARNEECTYAEIIACDRLSSLLKEGGRGSLARLFEERRTEALVAWEGGEPLIPGQADASAHESEEPANGEAPHQDVSSYAHSYLVGVDIADAVASVQSALVDRRLFAHTGLRVTELAEHVGLTAHQLAELFSKHIGKSFASYVNGWRVSYASQLIRSEREKSFLEIAYDAGFGSKTAFNVAFKQETGLTPSQYRVRVHG